MKTGWIIVREESHVDDKYWICEEKEDALKIARDVSAYWLKEYEPEKEDIDIELYGNLIFNTSTEDGFSVHVSPQTIRSTGEVNKEEFVVDKNGLHRI
jgi:hypothetical protein